MKPKYKENDLILIENLPPDFQEYIKDRIEEPNAGLVMVNKVIFCSEPLYLITWPAKGERDERRHVLCSYIDGDDDTVSKTNERLRLECLRLACQYYHGQNVYQIADKMYKYVTKEQLT